MKLGFLLYEYFPFGGLQRDCLRTALACAKRGAEVTIFTRTWEGDRPEGVAVEAMGWRGWSNVSRNRNWLRRLQAMLPARKLDGLVGFNKLPGLDVYFGSDPCYVAKMERLRPFWYRWSARYRFFRQMESSVFGPGGAGRILLLTDHEVPVYRSIYGTEPGRFHVLPPGIERRVFTPEGQDKARRQVRAELGVSEEETLLLLVGSGFRVKGLDRAIAALAALSAALRGRTQLVVIGQNRAEPFARQAGRMGVRDRVRFLGARADVPTWLLGADLLVHPAYSEAAGMVLLEALTCGLPVLTTDRCGYAFHIRNAGAGIVLSSPFDQEACNRALEQMLAAPTRAPWRQGGLAYAGQEDLYHCHEEAARVIEETVQSRPACRRGAG